jgi:hypothetical protein
MYATYFFYSVVAGIAIEAFLSGVKSFLAKDKSLLFTAS